MWEKLLADRYGKIAVDSEIVPFEHIADHARDDRPANLGKIHFHIPQRSKRALKHRVLQDRLSFELVYLMRFSVPHIRLRFACAKRQCEHVASPPYLRSVLPGCHLQSIWYRLYRKTVAALDCRMSASRLMLEPSGGVLLELS
jgi:hypothetical protein